MNLLKFTIALCIIGLSFQSKAQQRDVIHFKSGDLEPKILDASAIVHQYTPDELVIDSYYRIILFNEIPNQKFLAELKSAGIDLLMYLPHNAYYAAIEQNANIQILENKVTSIFKLENTQKLSVDLAKQDYPDWALVGSNSILVNAIYYDNISPDFISNEMQNKTGIKFIADKTGNRVELEVNIAELNNLYALPYFYYFEEIDAPSEPENLVGVTNHRSNNLATSYTNGLQYDGTGVTVMLQDNSLLDDHIDYSGRFFDQPSASQSGDHGEHCGGILGGAGNLDPTARGMAYGADVLVFGSSNNNYDDVPTLYATGNLTITSKSYGDGLNGGYTSLASELDEQIHNMPSLVHVFSCGNSGTSSTGAAGAGWYNITGGHKTGKNVIACGNLTQSDVISNSSSRGPSEDGRIKPDICAVGSSVYSTQDPNGYDVKSGTSMACPGVAGTLAQLYHAYKDLNGGTNPNSGLMKATILNTADDLGNIGPDYIYGWGRINARRAYNLISNNNYIAGSSTQGSTNNHTINVPAGTDQLKIMLYWLDVEGAAGASVALVNDLDLIVTDPAVTAHNPYILDNSFSPAALDAPATTGVDHVNNMEQVVIDNPAAGTYNIDVTGFAIPFGAQEYYVVYEYVTDDVVLTYPIGGEGIDHAENERIRWDAFGNSGTFNLEYSIDNGSNWLTIDNSVSASTRFYDWNVPNVVTGEALVRITRGASTSQSHEEFSIIGVPTGLNVISVCPDSMEVSWNAVAGATGYEVSLLGSKYMDSVGVSSTTSLVIAASASVDHWWSVKALGPNNCEGQRAFAVYQGAGVVNCTIPIDAGISDNMGLNGATLTECTQSGDITVEVVVTNNGTTSISNVPVYYQFNSGSIVNETISSTIAAGGTFIYTFAATATPVIGNNDLAVWVDLTNDGNSLNDTTYSNFDYSSASAQTLPWSEDFEGFSGCGTASDCEAENCNLFNNFINESNGTVDDVDWRTNSGDTPSNTTGPSTDYLPGTINGNYLYIEASGSCENNTAILTSPCIDLTNETTCLLEFAYHMMGDDMGSLHLDIFVNGSWTQDIIPAFVNDQGNNWNQEVVDLGAYVGNTVTLRWRGTTGNGYSSDIAIDAINMFNTANLSDLNSDLNFKIFPNPSEGIFNFNYSGSDDLNITIVDASGSQVYSTGLNAETKSGNIDLSDYANGIYIMTATSEAVTFSRKIVKR